MYCMTRQVDVKNMHNCKWVDVKCLVFTLSAAWEVIIFIPNTVKVLIPSTSGIKGLLDI